MIIALVGMIGICVSAWLSKDRIFAALFPRVAIKSIEQMLRAAIGAVNERYGSTTGHYNVLWTVIIGPEGSGKKFILHDAEKVYFAEEDRALCSAVVCEKGVIIRVSGALLFTAGNYMKYWNALVSGLQRLRPQMPLSSIVLILPHAELIKENFVLYRNILKQFSELQQSLGLRLSVYVMISQCQKIPGFNVFTERLESDAVLGWSAPSYPAEQDWIQGSLESLNSSLIELSHAMIVSDCSVSDQVLSMNYQTKQSELRVSQAITELFKPESQLIVPSVRGLYLSATQDDRAMFDNRAMFCDDLFERKIFSEDRLACSLRFESDVQRFLRHGFLSAAVLLPFIMTGGVISDYLNLRGRCLELRKNVAALPEYNALLRTPQCDDKNIENALNLLKTYYF